MDPRHPSKLPLSLSVPVPVQVSTNNTSPFLPAPAPAEALLSTASTTTPPPPTGSISIPYPRSATTTPVFINWGSNTHTHRHTHSRTPSYDIARAESHPHLENFTSHQNPAYAVHTFAQRRSSDTNFYPQPQSQISHDSNTARSITHNPRTFNHEMPPPTSPPNRGENRRNRTKTKINSRTA
ncbi:hypothetical protein FPOAC1_003482 [Fusarium poae]|uniref:hypothetical protein n=1 Tax=Fusarium poae TaxID=36050 RepID=UPI001CE9A23E|nr:hypothetical protein FPOAC1_003482 [Fusarium poae]KAG8677464.1 hypothetical protein FPOAC1_003482 [Fusarium poae]